MTKLSQRAVPDHGPRLAESEISELKQELNPAWEIHDNKLKRHFDFSNFRESKAFVDRVSELAEQVNHHPDITFSFRYVDIALYTHFRQGLTEADFALAAKIDEL